MALPSDRQRLSKWPVVADVLGDDGAPTRSRVVEHLIVRCAASALERLAQALEVRFVMGFETGPRKAPVRELVTASAWRAPRAPG